MTYMFKLSLFLTERFCFLLYCDHVKRTPSVYIKVPLLLCLFKYSWALLPVIASILRTPEAKELSEIILKIFQVIFQKFGLFLRFFFFNELWNFRPTYLFDQPWYWNFINILSYYPAKTLLDPAATLVQLTKASPTRPAPFPLT